MSLFFDWYNWPAVRRRGRDARRRRISVGDGRRLQLRRVRRGLRPLPLPLVRLPRVVLRLLLGRGPAERRLRPHAPLRGLRRRPLHDRLRHELARVDGHGQAVARRHVRLHPRVRARGHQEPLAGDLRARPRAPRRAERRERVSAGVRTARIRGRRSIDPAAPAAKRRALAAPRTATPPPRRPANWSWVEYAVTDLPEVQGEADVRSKPYCDWWTDMTREGLDGVTTGDCLAIPGVVCDVDGYVTDT